MAISYALRPAASASTVDNNRGAASRKLSATLWTLQSLLALIFLASGGMKLLAPAEMMEAQSPLPLLLVRFIATCEVAGALGMLLPGLLRIRPALTPLAAASLVVLMICATVLTPIMVSPDPIMVLIPATVGALAAFVAYARVQLAPMRSRQR